MKEVHRYKVVKMLSEDGNRISYDPHGPEVVLAPLLDSALVREAALREELANTHELAGLNAKLALALQQRLTVAEQRAFELTGLLKLSLLAVDDVAENCEDQTDWATANSMHALSKRITAALKPAEEVGSNG